MEIFSDSDCNRAIVATKNTSGLRQNPAGLRTPLVDVKNVAELRCDLTTTPLKPTQQSSLKPGIKPTFNTSQPATQTASPVSASPSCESMTNTPAAPSGMESCVPPSCPTTFPDMEVGAEVTLLNEDEDSNDSVVALSEQSDGSCIILEDSNERLTDVSLLEETDHGCSLSTAGDHKYHKSPQQENMIAQADNADNSNQRAALPSPDSDEDDLDTAHFMDEAKQQVLVDFSRPLQISTPGSNIVIPSSSPSPLLPLLDISSSSDDELEKAQALKDKALAFTRSVPSSMLSQTCEQADHLNHYESLDSSLYWPPNLPKVLNDILPSDTGGNNIPETPFAVIDGNVSGNNNYNFGMSNQEASLEPFNQMLASPNSLPYPKCPPQSPSSILGEESCLPPGHLKTNTDIHSISSESLNLEELLSDLQSVSSFREHTGSGGCVDNTDVPINDVDRVADLEGVVGISDGAVIECWPPESGMPTAMELQSLKLHNTTNREVARFPYTKNFTTAVDIDNIEISSDSDPDDFLEKVGPYWNLAISSPAKLEGLVTYIASQNARRRVRRPLSNNESNSLSCMPRSPEVIAAQGETMSSHMLPVAIPSVSSGTWNAQVAPVSLETPIAKVTPQTMQPVCGESLSTKVPPACSEISADQGPLPSVQSGEAMATQVAQPTPMLVSNAEVLAAIRMIEELVEGGELEPADASVDVSSAYLGNVSGTSSQGSPQRNIEHYPHGFENGTQHMEIPNGNKNLSFSSTNSTDVSRLTKGMVHKDVNIEDALKATGQSQVSFPTTDASTATDLCTRLDVSTFMEKIVTADRSVLAAAECRSQETMTERSVVDVASSMTPLKLGKHGSSRLTAEEVRRQHPRVVANQIETTLVANQRLEKEARATAKEKVSLKSALKEIKSSLHDKDSTIARLESEIVEIQHKLDQQTSALEQEQEARWTAEQSLQATIDETDQRCRQKDAQRREAERHFHTQLSAPSCDQMEQVRTESSSYQQQYKAAQGKIRLLQAGQEEYQQLVSEVDKSYGLQSRLKAELTKMSAGVKSLAGTNLQLKEENSSLKKRCVSREVDLDVVRYENRELLQDNERMNGLLERSNHCIEELDVLLKSTNADVNRLQDNLAEQLEENNALTQANEELRRSKAMMVIQLSESQASNDVTLQALREAEAQIKSLEETLEKERRVLATGKAMHENMKASFEESSLKLEMEIHHLEKMLDVSEVKREAQEQELYDCQEQIASLQEAEVSLSARTEELATAGSRLDVVNQVVQALLDTINFKLGVSKAKGPLQQLNSSTPKDKQTVDLKRKESSFLGEVLNVLKGSQASGLDISAAHNSGMRGKRQQSNVEFGAARPEFGAAACAMLSPHSQSFCCGPTGLRGDEAGSTRKSLSFSEGQSRRELFKEPSTRMRPQGEEEGDGKGAVTPGYARIRSLPGVAEQMLADPSMSTKPGTDSHNMAQKTESTLAEELEELEEGVSQVVKAVRLLDRAAELRVKDAQDETHYVRGQLKQEESVRQCVESDLEEKSAALISLNVQHKELQARVADMTKSLLTFHDQSFEISRLEEEKQDLKWKVTSLESQSSMLSDHLKAMVNKLDATMAGHLADRFSEHELVESKKKNHELMMQLFQERDQHKSLGEKAVKRMKILDSNWKKAEAEVTRLDELVEQIREGCVGSQAQSTHPLILGIVRLIDGKIASLEECRQRSMEPGLSTSRRTSDRHHRKSLSVGPDKENKNPQAASTKKGTRRSSIWGEGGQSSVPLVSIPVWDKACHELGTRGQAAGGVATPSLAGNADVVRPRVCSPEPHGSSAADTACDHSEGQRVRRSSLSAAFQSSGSALQEKPGTLAQSSRMFAQSRGLHSQGWLSSVLNKPQESEKEVGRLQHL